MRDYGAGQIREVAPGRWRLRVSAGTDPVTGKRRVITETFSGGRKAAQVRLGALVAEHGGRQAGSNVTLDVLIGAWLDASSHAAQTRANYDRARSRIPTALRSAAADRVSPHDLQRLYSSIAERFGPHATHYLHALVSGSYSHGRRLRWVRDHPARDLLLPALGKRPKSTPSPEVVRLLLAAASTEQHRLWIRLAVVLGRRRSEVLALRWADADLDAAVVRVERALEQGGAVKATKGEDQAEVAIDPRTVAAVRSWQLAQRERALAAGVRLAADPWLFSDEPDSSRPWRPDLASRRWAALRKRAGVDARVRLNDLRHANVTQLIAAGVDPRTVAGRVGHDPTMSLGTYAALVDEANRNAAARIAALIDSA